MLLLLLLMYLLLLVVDVVLMQFCIDIVVVVRIVRCLFFIVQFGYSVMLGTFDLIVVVTFWCCCYCDFVVI